MKKSIFIGIFMFMAGNIFSQIAPMDKSQQKRVKQIHKEIQQRHNNLIKHPTMTVDEKKASVEATKSERDARLSGILSPEQVVAVKQKDPVDWDGAVRKINSQEKSRLKVERDQKLRDVDKEIRDVEGQQDDLKLQINDLKRKQKDLDDLQKILKQKRKDINTQYK